jgi:hypothetical protein
MRPTICSLFEPHHKQNPYTNPKRTAKFASPNIILDALSRRFVQIDFRFSKKFFAAAEEPDLAKATFHRLRIASSAGPDFFLHRSSQGKEALIAFGAFYFRTGCAFASEHALAAKKRKRRITEKHRDRRDSRA